MRDKRKRLVSMAACRARRKGIACTITWDDLWWPTRCPVFDIELDYNLQKQSANSPSLDRVDASLGYVPGNVRVISWRANKLKGDATTEELVALSRWALEERQ